MPRCPRTRSRSPGCRAAGAGGGVEFPEMQRASATIASRSASAPGDDDHGGGMNDGAVSPRRSVSTSSASRSMVSVTHGGGRSPELRSAVAASAIWWLTLRIAISRMSSSFRPLAADRPVSSVSYAVFSAAVTARRVVTTSRSADRPQVVGDGVVDGGDGALFRAPRRQQPGRHDQQQRPIATPATNPSAVCHHGRSAPERPEAE